MLFITTTKPIKYNSCTYVFSDYSEKNGSPIVPVEFGEDETAKQEEFRRIDDMQVVARKQASDQLHDDRGDITISLGTFR